MCMFLQQKNNMHTPAEYLQWLAAATVCRCNEAHLWHRSAWLSQRHSGFLGCSEESCPHLTWWLHCAVGGFLWWQCRLYHDTDNEDVVTNILSKRFSDTPCLYSQHKHKPLRQHWAINKEHFEQSPGNSQYGMEVGKFNKCGAQNLI